MLGYYYNSRSPDRECPRCAGSVVRIKRVWVDRTISALLFPVHRYRCEELGCNWEGRLKIAQDERRIEPFLHHLTNEKLGRSQQLARVADDSSTPRDY
jgi:hypothetical protein